MKDVSKPAITSKILAMMAISVPWKSFTSEDNLFVLVMTNLECVGIQYLDLIETTGATEIQYPWEVARARFFGQCLKDALQKNQAKSLLDIGGGDGFMLTILVRLLKTWPLCVGTSIMIRPI